MTTDPCRVKNCPGLRLPKSIFGYCSVHNWVAEDNVVFNLALNNKLTKMLREFALDIERGIYPRKLQ